ncbi:MAG: SDR family NAD(P)-dependent oxidoreductase, partial [Anaerolineae bacterium]
MKENSENVITTKFDDAVIGMTSHLFKSSASEDWQSLPKTDVTHGTTMVRRADLADWFYIPSWKRSLLPEFQTPSVQNHWLLFINNDGFGMKLAEHLKGLNQRVSVVRAAEVFSHHHNDGDQLTIQPFEEADYIELFKSLEHHPDKIVHLWGCVGEIPENSEYESFFSLFLMAKALAQTQISQTIQIGVVAHHLYDVLGGEQIVADKGMMLGPIQVIEKEIPNITCKAIDFPEPQPDGLMLNQILAEMLEERATEVAWRGRHRWVRTFESVHLPASAEVKSSLKRQGIYLITGGFGGIGFALAEHLAETVQAKLVLIGRSAFPKRAEWGMWLNDNGNHNSTSKKILQVRELEKAGGQVLVLRGDVTDPDDMRAVFEAAMERFGPVNGVFHTAGSVEDGIIQLKEVASAQRVLEAKVTGTKVIFDLLTAQHGEFMVLFSSTHAYLAPAGQVDYSSANRFMDMFAENEANLDKLDAPALFSIGWPAWQEVGMVSKMKDSAQKTQLLAKGVSNANAMEAIERIMHHGLAHTIVSPIDFLAEFEGQNRPTIAIESLTTERQDTALAAKKKIGSPKRGGIYTNNIQKTIASIWEDLLEVEEPQLKDNFFDLGGSSLSAVHLLAQLGESTGVHLPFETLHERPTLEEFSSIFELETEEKNDEENILEKPKAKTISADSTPTIKNLKVKTGTVPNLKRFESRWRSLIKIQQGIQSKTPLFLMHGAAGDVQIYKDFARHLGQKQTVYGLRSVGLHSKSNHHTTIGQMAGHYAQEILRERPEGPYMLGGYHIGG